MAQSKNDSNYTADWWRALNSAAIWLTVVVLLALIFLTSMDTTGHLTLFGANQILILGFITVLLLFKYISKIKIGPIEIDFRVVERELIDAKQSIETARAETAGIAALTRAQSDAFRDASDKITGALAIIKYMKDKYS